MWPTHIISNRLLPIKSVFDFNWLGMDFQPIAAK